MCNKRKCLACYRQYFLFIGSFSVFWVFYITFLQSQEAEYFPKNNKAIQTVIKYTANITTATSISPYNLQKERQRIIADVCRRNGKYIRSSNWPYKLHISKRFLYCPIPKAGWSSWKRLWFYIAGVIKDIDEDIGLAADSKAGVMDVKGARGVTIAYGKHLYNYSFVFVRNPWERLVSAYINKAVDFNYTRTLHAPCKWESLKPYKPDLTFEQFLTCIVDFKSTDMHWVPQHRLCDFCNIKYDYIGHLETVEEDSKTILNMLGINISYPHIFKSKKYQTRQIMNEWYKNISAATLSRIKAVFSYDFELHGYDKNPPGRVDVK